MPALPPRSALFVAWGGAWLAGAAGVEEAARRMTALDDASAVAGLQVDDVPVARALTRLRADGVTRLRLVLPAPGDPTGLPGPGPFTGAALAAGEGALAVRGDGSALGLVPEVTEHGTPLDGTSTTVRWAAFAVERTPTWPGPFLADAEDDLRRGILEVAAALRDLDVARWRPELADSLRELRVTARIPISNDELPEAYPMRARELLGRTRRLAEVLTLAGQDAGGSVDTRETSAREAHLRELARLVRRARVAAYNALADSQS